MLVERLRFTTSSQERSTAVRDIHVRILCLLIQNHGLLMSASRLPRLPVR
jgi:hypothetical protein